MSETCETCKHSETTSKPPILICWRNHRLTAMSHVCGDYEPIVNRMHEVFGAMPEITDEDIAILEAMD